VGLVAERFNRWDQYQGLQNELSTKPCFRVVFPEILKFYILNTQYKQAWHLRDRKACALDLIEKDLPVITIEFEISKSLEISITGLLERKKTP
jgi:hypothetical protein